MSIFPKLKVWNFSSNAFLLTRVLSADGLVDVLDFERDRNFKS